jgi:hypothetical protein
MQAFGEEATLRDLDNPNMTIFSRSEVVPLTATPTPPTTIHVSLPKEVYPCLGSG